MDAIAKRSSEANRLDIALTGQFAEIVDEIATATGTSRTAVIGQAIALMKLAHDEKQKGRHLGFTADSSRLDTEVTGAF